jgi:hypothetical protein
MWWPAVKVLVGRVAVLAVRVAAPTVEVVPLVASVVSRKVMAPDAFGVEARVAVSCPVP